MQEAAGTEADKAFKVMKNPLKFNASFHVFLDFGGLGASRRHFGKRHQKRPQNVMPVTYVLGVHVVSFWLHNRFCMHFLGVHVYVVFLHRF